MRLIFKALLCLCLVASGRAQLLTVSAGNLTDSSNTTVSNATITFAPVLNNGLAASYRKGTSGGQVIIRPVSATVTSGAFSIVLVDTALTNPANICYAVTVTDNVTGASLLGPGYSCVQPTSTATWCGGSSCNFDAFPPNLSPMLPVQSGPTGATGAAGPQGPIGAPTSGLNLTSAAAQSVVQGTVTGTHCVTSTCNVPTYVNFNALSVSNNTLGRNAGGTLNCYGDSYMIGFGTSPTTSYCWLLANAMGWNATNHAVSGAALPDMASLGQYVFTNPITTASNTLLGMGSNNATLVNNGTTNLPYRLDWYRQDLAAWLAWLGTPDTNKTIGQAGVASGAISTTGTIANASVPAGIGILLESNGATATTTMTGTKLMAITIKENPNTSTFKFCADSNAYCAVYQPNPAAGFNSNIDVNTQDGGTFSFYAVTIDLPAGQHTVTFTCITGSVSDPCVVYAFIPLGIGAGLTSGPLVTVELASLFGHASSVYANHTDQFLSDFKEVEKSVLSEMAAAGIQVTYFDPNGPGGYDPNNTAITQADSIHPNNAGQALIANLAISAVNSAVAPGDRTTTKWEGVRNYRGGVYAGDTVPSEGFTTLVSLPYGGMGSSTYRTTGSFNTGYFGLGIDGNGSVQRFANDSTSHGAIFGLIDGVDGVDSVAFGEYAAGFPLLYFDLSVDSALTYNFGVFGKGTRLNIRANQGLFDNGVQVPTIKSTTGARYVCVDTNGNLVSQAAACSGT